jgi:hypothetical protein
LDEDTGIPSAHSRVSGDDYTVFSRNGGHCTGVELVRLPLRHGFEVSEVVEAVVEPYGVRMLEVIEQCLTYLHYKIFLLIIIESC